MRELGSANHGKKRRHSAPSSTSSSSSPGAVPIPAFRGLRRTPEELDAKQQQRRNSSTTTASSIAVDSRPGAHSNNNGAGRGLRQNRAFSVAEAASSAGASMTVLRGLRKNNTNSSICSPGDKSTTSSADDTRACTGVAAKEIRRKRVSCAAAAGEGDTRVAPRTSARAQAIRRKRVSASASSPQQRVAESAAANSAAVDATSASGQTPQDLEAQNLVDNNSKDEEEAAGDERPGMVREAEMRDNEAPVDEEIAEMNEPAPSNLPEETEAFKEMELVEARPVAVDDITHAETTLTPVDPGILERETIKKQKEIECQRIGAMLICMLVLVMMLSIIFARGSSGEQDLLAMPMVAPALVPTSTPTTAPTSSLLSVFVTNHMPQHNSVGAVRPTLTPILGAHLAFDSSFVCRAPGLETTTIACLGHLFLFLRRTALATPNPK